MRRRLRQSKSDGPPEIGAPPPAFEALLQRELAEPSDGGAVDLDFDLDLDGPTVLDPPSEPWTAPPTPTAPSQAPPVMASDPLPDADLFWDRYDRAAAAADLFAVPPAAVTAVIGPLDVAVPVARRCLERHWVSDCEVFVLTDRPHVPGEPSWKVLSRPSEVVAVLEEGLSDFPLIVLDIPRELPAFVRPLVARLRNGGVGLVHYVLDGDPDDEDLATWHGELGRPAVLDLAAAVEPGRVLELLGRGEPVAGVAGMAITTELLLAMRAATDG